MDLDQLPHFSGNRQAEELFEGCPDVLPDAAGHQRPSAPAGAGDEHYSVRASGNENSLTMAGRIFADYAEQILDLRRRAQDSINELEKVPRGELVIAGNEATCIYVLPRVFAEFKKRFPNVQLLVDRSYGTRVVQAVMDNQADFGLTQLPVEEKKLEAVKIHSDEIRLLVPYHHRLAQYSQVLPQDLLGEPLLIPKTGTTRAD